MLGKLFIFMALPECPRLGTLLFKKEIIGQKLSVIQPKWNLPTPSDIDMYMTPPMKKFRAYSRHILTNLTMNPSLPVSALDVTAMLTPVPDYFDARSYQLHFPKGEGKSVL